MTKAYYDDYWRDETASPDFDPTTDERKRRLAAAVRGLGGGAALDLGCGRGSFTEFLGSLGFDAYGVDISETAVRKAQDQFTQRQFSPLGPDGTIPFEDSRFDVVWSSEVIEHIFDVPAHLAEIHRVLRPGGFYILTTPYHGVLKDILVSVLKFDTHFDPLGPHIRFFDRRGLGRCLRGAGFIPRSWGGIGRVPWLWRTWFVVCEKEAAPGQSPEFHQ